jgi:hypothetical protein
MRSPPQRIQQWPVAKRCLWSANSRCRVYLSNQQIKVIKLRGLSLVFFPFPSFLFFIEYVGPNNKVDLCLVQFEHDLEI